MRRSAGAWGKRPGARRPRSSTSTWPPIFWKRRSKRNWKTARQSRERSYSRIPTMDDTADTARVIVRPPLAWGLAVIAALALGWLVPLRFVPAAVPARWLDPRWLGAAVFVLALALFAWAIVTVTRAGSNVPTNRPTTAIVESGPYRFTRNPIY